LINHGFLIQSDLYPKGIYIYNIDFNWVY
jgi:hypothetical protein